MYSKVVIVEPTQPMDLRAISDSLESALAFRVVGAAVRDVHLVQLEQQ
jgi:hypothetical protein